MGGRRQPRGLAYGSDLQVTRPGTVAIFTHYTLQTGPCPGGREVKAWDALEASICRGRAGGQKGGRCETNGANNRRRSLSSFVTLLYLHSLISQYPKPTSVFIPLKTNQYQYHH